MQTGLQGKLDAGQSSAGAGFLPGVHDAVNYGDGGHHGDDPQNRAHAVEKPADDQKHQALRALHESHFAKGN